MATHQDNAAAQPVHTVHVDEAHSGTYVQNMHSGAHTLIADEPTALGGNDKGPNPYEYMLMALGACTNMTLRMYADMKGLPVSAVSTRLSLAHIHAEDCVDCASKTGRVVEITRDIAITGDLDDAQRERLLEIANKCPIHKVLTSEVKIRSRLAAPAAR